MLEFVFFFLRCRPTTVRSRWRSAAMGFGRLLLQLERAARTVGAGEAEQQLEFLSVVQGEGEENSPGRKGKGALTPSLWERRPPPPFFFIVGIQGRRIRLGGSLLLLRSRPHPFLLFRRRFRLKFLDGALDSN